MTTERERGAPTICFYHGSLQQAWRCIMPCISYELPRPAYYMTSFLVPKATVRLREFCCPLSATSNNPWMPLFVDDHMLLLLPYAALVWTRWGGWLIPLLLPWSTSHLLLLPVFETFCMLLHWRPLPSRRYSTLGGGRHDDHLVVAGRSPFSSSRSNTRCFAVGSLKEVLVMISRLHIPISDGTPPMVSPPLCSSRTASSLATTDFAVVPQFTATAAQWWTASATAAPWSISFFWYPLLLVLALYTHMFSFYSHPALYSPLIDVGICYIFTQCSKGPEGPSLVVEGKTKNK